jgi:hypothetical protein
MLTKISTIIWAKLPKGKISVNHWLIDIKDIQIIATMQFYLIVLIYSIQKITACVPQNETRNMLK